MQANAGAKAWVLLIMDSSHSMNDEFSDLYRLPAYMDDFVYVENSANVGPVSYGSKIAIAKSVIRDVIAKSETGSGINWAFSYYRNPGQVLGAADTSTIDGTPVGGAKAAGDALENGGLEWLYFANCVSNNAGTCQSPQLISGHVPDGGVSGPSRGPFPPVRPQGDAELLPRFAPPLHRQQPQPGHVARGVRAARPFRREPRHGHLPQCQRDR